MNLKISPARSLESVETIIALLAMAHSQQGQSSQQPFICLQSLEDIGGRGGENGNRAQYVLCGILEGTEPATEEERLTAYCHADALRSRRRALPSLLDSLDRFEADPLNSHLLIM